MHYSSQRIVFAGICCTCFAFHFSTGSW